MAKEGLKKTQEKGNRSRNIKLGGIIIFVFFLSILFFYIYQQSQNSPDNSSLNDNADDIMGVSAEDTEAVKYQEKICVSDSIAPSLVEHLSKKLETDIEVVYSNDQDCLIVFKRGRVDSNDYDSVWKGLYVPVVRFDSSIEDIPSNSIDKAIKSQAYGNTPIIWSKSAESYINSNFGSDIVQSFANSREVVSKLKESSEIIGIIPIHLVEPHLKIITIDGNHPSDDGLNLFTYPLTDIIWVSDGSEGKVYVQPIQVAMKGWDTVHQFKPNAFERFVLTGYSAVGARQYMKKINDPTFDPLSSVSQITDDAEVFHVSNNNSFTNKCSQQNNSETLCGREIALNWLIQNGVDVIGLTGSGNLDYGRPVFENSLNTYMNNNIEYFGGGDDKNDAGKAVYKEFGTDSISFLGFSLVAPRTFLAGNNFSGIAAADKVNSGDALLMKEIIQALDKNTKVNVVEMQWGDQSGRITDTERIYGKAAINSGADIVIGTTSHEPKGIQFYNDGVIFYGLGDFLYLEGEESTGLLIENLIYKGKYIGFNLHPVVIDGNLTVRLAEVDKKAEILNTVYSTSSIQK